MEKRLQSIPLKNIRIQDEFWDRYIKLVTSKILPYQWEVLNDRVEDAELSHCIRNFEIAAGRKSGEFYGFVFQDTDLAKWIEAAAYSLACHEDKKLVDTVDWAIELIGEAQQPDGYINTYFTIKEPEGRFTNLSEGHELYTAGHMMEAAVAYYNVTGKDKFLKIMCKMADLLCDTFYTESFKNAIPGHQEVEIGLIKLYGATGERRYLDLAKAFIDRRGHKPNHLEEERKKEGWKDVFHNPDPFIPEYSQCDEPVRIQKTARGHAVRAVYMYSAMADLAYEYKDKELMDACERLYEDIVQRQMYITGGIGQSGIYERFTVDYDLPNDRNYSETCASIGLALFCRRMAQITHDSGYVDTMERALINTVIAGISMDGEKFFYVNPLEVWPENLLPYTSMAHVKPVRQRWFGCACCPPNIARTLASLGEYAVFVSDNSVWINMYMGEKFEIDLKGAHVDIEVKTKMPFAGQSSIAVHSDRDICFELMLRIPEYADKSSVRVTTEAFSLDGETVSSHMDKGYLRVEVGLDSGNSKSSEIQLDFDIHARFIYANTNVRADAGKVAVVKGPIVYAMEEADNASNLFSFAVDTKAAISEKWDEELFGGCMVLEVSGVRSESPDGDFGNLYSSDAPKEIPASMKLIPYAYWNNRGKGEMLVWMRRLSGK
jgi:DUF1680 family protein